jgi:hypothetical protein
MAETMLAHAVGARKRRDECHASYQQIEPGFQFDSEPSSAPALRSSRSTAVHQYKIGFTG